MSGQLILHPLGGLGNRLLSLLCAMRISEMEGRQLRIVWDTVNDLPFHWLPFTHLFQNDELLISADELPSDVKWITANRDVPGGHLLVLPEDSGAEILAIEHYFFMLRHKEPVMTQNEFTTQLQKQFQKLIISAYANDCVKQYKDFDFTNTLGVHIRRPSHEKDFTSATEYDNMWYVHMINSVQLALNLEKVFISCLDINTIEFMESHIKNVTFFRGRESDRTHPDPESLQDAFVDMLLLSKCPYISRHTASTFGVVSSIIGNTPQLGFNKLTGEQVLLLEPGCMS